MLCETCGKEIENDWRQKYNRKTPLKYCSQPCKQRANSRKAGIKFPVSKELFQPITIEQAWFLGFFCADGCITGERTFQFGQSGEAGKSTMDWIQREVFKQSPLREYNYVANHYALTYTSPETIQRFLEFGITPKKSLTLNFRFDLLPEPFIPAFICGYTEGDGSIGIAKRTYGKYVLWDLIGTESLIKFIAQYLQEKGFVAHISTRKGYWFLRSQHKTTLPLLEFLYSPSLYRGRKYWKWKTFQEEQSDSC